MELRSIYNVKSIKTTDRSVVAKITFNKEHKVFEGHFPDNPIVPGVVQVQIMKDLLEKALQTKLFLKSIKSIKYLNVINPLETGEVLFDITFDKQPDLTYKVKCVVKTESQVFMKYSGSAVSNLH